MSSKSRGRATVGDAIAIPEFARAGPAKIQKHYNPTFYKNIKRNGLSKRDSYVNRIWNGTLVPQIFDQTLEHNQKMILVLGGCALRYEKWKGRMV